ncbi:MAG: SRPBCC family protein [Pseudomonadota bacterium]
MENLEMQTVCLVAAEKVWRMLGSFDRIGKWHPLVTEVECTDQHTRTIKLQSGDHLTERRVTHSDLSMQLEMESGSWPLTALTSTISVEDAGVKRSRVTWRAQFEAADSQAAREAIEGFVLQAFSWLNGRYGKDYADSA